jgi:hypothetical protein
MNVFITDETGLHVSGGLKGAIVNVYRMFDSVLVIFTKRIFL